MKSHIFVFLTPPRRPLRLPLAAYDTGAEPSDPKINKQTSPRLDGRNIWIKFVL